jgi:hypothetical protein
MYFSLSSVHSNLAVQEALAAICSWNTKTVSAFNAMNEVHCMSFKITFSSQD